ncbi:hypothetical protein MNB_SUP05-SYMBIONT-7-558 [hydrothermal vent metagenome]|uniref:Uncharacterized protein n=1 Tax=hydrothermal vent metagenome TaxID=652676 RepID=A0A1W1E511_9ZZZZ
MQIIFKLLGLIVLFFSGSVLSSPMGQCKTSGSEKLIPYSMYDARKIECTCDSGYTGSGFDGTSPWKGKGSNNEFNNNATCIKNTTITNIVPAWLIPAAIATLAAVPVVAVVGDKAYKYFRSRGTTANPNPPNPNPGGGGGDDDDSSSGSDTGSDVSDVSDISDASWSDMPWEGSESDYIGNNAIFNHQLRGAERMNNLTDDYELDLNFSKQYMDGYHTFGEGSAIKYDPVTKQNVLIDNASSKRLLARWDVDSEQWNAVEGAERWRFSNKFGYRVIATSDKNYLNPKTGLFQAEEWQPTASKGETLKEYIDAFPDKTRLSIKGAGDTPFQNLGLANKEDLDYPNQLYQARRYQPPGVDKTFKIRYDAVGKKNILADENDYQLAEWDTKTTKWTPIDGAERWRYSDIFEHKVIAKTDADFLDPHMGKFVNVPEPGTVWNGTEADYLSHPTITNHELRGDKFMENLTSTTKEDSDYMKQYMEREDVNGAFKNSMNNDTVTYIRYDPATKENVLVDADDRLMARWDPAALNGDGQWKNVDGAERWVYNDDLGYKVIGKDAKGKDFLNPNTQEFTRTASTADADASGWDVAGPSGLNADEAAAAVAAGKKAIADRLAAQSLDTFKSPTPFEASGTSGTSEFDMEFDVFQYYRDFYSPDSSDSSDSEAETGC